MVSQDHAIALQPGQQKQNCETPSQRKKKELVGMVVLFCFHMKFKVVFSSSVKKVIGSLMGIALNL